MRQNHPVTEREHDFAEQATLMSTTDPASRITYANAAFVAVSGFERHELLGEPHNLVRHPDMPREAFSDMWATLKAGDAWTALVKNRRKNGDFYWVRANVAPMRRAGQLLGYLSVRTRPARQEVAAAEALYREFRDGQAGRRAFHKGLVVRTGWLRWTSAMQLMPVRWRIRLAFGAVAAGSAAAVFGMLGGAADGLALAAPALTVLTTLLSAAACAWLERQVAAPLARVLRQAADVAAGQTEPAPPLARVDEIGLLARAVTQAGLNLRALLDDVGAQAGGVRQASAEIASGNVDLSSRTEQTAASLEQTAASMTEIGSTLAGNAARTRQAEDLAHAAVQCAATGSADVTRVAQTMSDIEAGSRRIGEIVALIDSIAFQTNLLALNAAVEAARAGEQGRGFAVVAAEVRALAGRSAAAAREVRSLIQRSMQHVEAGGGLVTQATRTMDEVMQGVRRVSGLIEEIAHATAEQADGVGQIETAVAQLDQATQQNAALVEQGAAASEALKQQAAHLDEAVAVFRTEVAPA